MSIGHVLLIDDDAAFRFAMQKALRRAGFEVTEASDGEPGFPRGGRGA